MGEDERRLSDLLRGAVAEPEVGLSFDELADVRRRRRRTSALIAAAATALAIAVPVSLWATSPRGEEPPVVAEASPSAAPTSSSSPLVVGCPPTEPLPGGQVAMVDYVDFVQFQGRQYLAQMPDQHVAPDQLGFGVGAVTCEISKLTEAGDRRVAGPFLDGNASYLPAGTVLRAVSGYDASCRVAVRFRGDVRVYLAQEEGGQVSTPRQCALAPSPDAPVVTRCEALPPVPQNVEMDTTADIDLKVFTYIYGNDNTTFTINYGEDPTCMARADVRRIVDHAIEAAKSAQ